MLMRDWHPDGGNNLVDTYDESQERIISFIQEFGSYLKLHSCLAYSALIEAAEVINCLIDLAKYDPSHKEMMKHSGRNNSLVFYEPVSLTESCV